MTTKFTDELRNISNEPVNPMKKVLSPKEQAIADKKEAISNGRLSSDFYDLMKKSLIKEVEIRQVIKQIREVEDDIPRYSFEIVYKPDEFKKKDDDYRLNYRDKESEYDYYTGKEEPIRRSQKIRAYVEYFTYHKVFNKNECDLIQWQLARKLKEDGFHYSFATKEFKRKICDGLGLFVPTTSFGFTLNLTVWWDK